MSYYGLTDTGKVRKNNEDSFLIKEISENIIAAVVADGMGGHVGGKEASTLAVNCAMKFIEESSQKILSYTDKQIDSFLKSTVTKVNKLVYAKSTDDAELEGMGTTLVLCIVVNDKFYVANVGDSRLYLYSDKLKQITKDHSYVAELVEMGIISEKQAETHPNKNIITRAVGIDKTVVSDTYSGKLENDNVILICSDGLSNMVSEEKITSIIKKNTDTQKAVTKLVELANKNGGQDNITAVAVKYEVGGAV